MRGLYSIPTRARKSEWYEIPGEFIAETLSGPATASSSRLSTTLQFQPRNSTTRFNLIPALPQPIPKSSSSKVIAALVPVGLEQAPVKWNSSLYLRRIEPTNATPYWDILAGPKYISISNSIVTDKSEQYHDNLVQNLLPFAIRITWPSGIPNDESGPEPPVIDHSKYDPRIWGKLKSAILQVLPLEEDQVTPQLTLSDLGTDSLDAVEIWMAIEEAFNLDIDDEKIEEVLHSSQSLDGIYQWIWHLSMDMRHA